MALVPAFLRLGGRPAIGYVSLHSALSLHGMISQVPRSVYVVCNQRMRRVRRTEVGTYEFYFMQNALVSGFRPYRTGTFDLATPEKAVFDVLYYSVRKGTRFAHLPELSLPHDFAVTAFTQWIARIGHDPLRGAVAKRWQRLRQAAGALGVA